MKTTEVITIDGRQAVKLPDGGRFADGAVCCVASPVTQFVASSVAQNPHLESAVSFRSGHLPKMHWNGTGMGMQNQPMPCPEPLRLGAFSAREARYRAVSG